MAFGSMRARVAFFTFVSLLACLTSLTIICFSMAILNDAFVYAGIGCLVGVVLLIGTYSGCRYCCRRSGACAGNPSSTREGSTTGSDHRRTYEEFSLTTTELRRIEREIEDLLTDATELQSIALCSPEILDRECENIRRESDQVAQWIEGTKVPETTEVRDLVDRLETIGSSLRSIRRRTERINSSLGVSRFGASSRSVPHSVTLHPQLLQPPSYEDSRRQQLHLPSIHFVPTLPAYSSTLDSRLSLAPPFDEIDAPPPYEEALGAPV